MIEKFNVFITPFALQRMIHVYLPNDYYVSEQRYPVMYMFDGHNLFNDEEATYGKSWGLQNFLDCYDKKMIVVGIECNHEGRKRLDEYCPYSLDNSFFGHIEGQGKELMDWVVNELKVQIDQKYRTYPFRECTGIAGSSMGGLMAFYTIIMYNNYFSKAACISPSISMCMESLINDFNGQVLDADTRVYFSFGTKEVRDENGYNWMLKNILWFNDQLIARQASSYINIIENGEHNEASWEKENPIYLDFLWK